METIKTLYENTELTLQQIADHTSTSPKQVFNYVARNYSREHRTERKRNSYRKSKTGSLNPMTGKTGSAHHNYVGVVGDSKGYLMELKPSWYTGRAGSKHVFQHHIVVCLSLGITEIPKGWCVHHVNENPHDNTFDNLVLMTLSDHQRLHQVLAGATTISKESTLKWVEAQGTLFSVMI
jgi:hypothetical protein